MHSMIQSCPQDLVDFDACTHKKHSCCSGASDAGFDQEPSSYCAGTCLYTIIYGEERGFQGPDRCVRLARGSPESAKASLLLEWAMTHRCVFSMTQSPHKHTPKNHLFYKNTRLLSEAKFEVLRARTMWNLYATNKVSEKEIYTKKGKRETFALFTLIMNDYQDWNKAHRMLTISEHFIKALYYSI